MGWLLFVSGALATFRLSHLVSKEGGPLSVFERVRNALPRGRGVGSGMAQRLGRQCYPRIAPESQVVKLLSGATSL